MNAVKEPSWIKTLKKIKKVLVDFSDFIVTVTNALTAMVNLFHYVSIHIVHPTINLHDSIYTP